jgi:hypothetical protein
MTNAISKLGSILKHYFSFVLGIIFGSTIATVVTYVILSLGLIEKLAVEEPNRLTICLMDELNE